MTSVDGFRYNKFAFRKGDGSLDVEAPLGSITLRNTATEEVTRFAALEVFGLGADIIERPVTSISSR